jgi:hypothetical protein
MNERYATDEALANERAVADLEHVEVLSLRTQVEVLQAELEECRAASFIYVSSGSNIQEAINDSPPGANLQLVGEFETRTLTPKEGQTFRGPATIVPLGLSDNNEDGFRCKGVEDVTFVDLDISGFGRHGIGCWIGTTVRGGRLHHNRKDGIGGDLEGLPSRIFVENAEIDNNGSQFWLGAGSAGAKFFHSHGVTVNNCNVHGNIGNGVWCDAQCGDWIVTNNRIEYNTRKGVFYEKGGAGDGTISGRSYAIYEGFALIENNTIVSNNTEGVNNANPGVAIYSSKNVAVLRNTFGGNGNAIIVRNDPKRINDEKHGWMASNVTLDGNSLNGDRIVGCDLVGVVCEDNA